MTQQDYQGEAGVFSAETLTALKGNTNELYGALVLAGTRYYCDPANGNDSNDGLTLATAKATLAGAYGLTASGKNDTVVLVGNGQASGSARLSANFDWSKDATHLIGVAAPTRVGGRARIAPTSGATAFANFFTLSGDGCIIQNIHMFHGFSTGTTSQICLTITGERNFIKNCHIGGMGDQESADDAGSRSVKIGSGGGGENTFVDCTIGLDTVTRGAANASVEFAGATPRNSFYNCTFPFQTDAAGVLAIIASGSGSMDRWQLFKDCSFINNVGSTSTTMTAGVTLHASSGGILVMKDSTTVGITDWATNTDTETQIWLDGAAPTATTSGIAVQSDIS